MEVDMVADMEVDKVADMAADKEKNLANMEMGRVADIKVDKVVDKVSDMVAAMVVDKKTTNKIKLVDMELDIVAGVDKVDNMVADNKTKSTSTLTWKSNLESWSRGLVNWA